jgi:hypothetical protein
MDLPCQWCGVVVVTSRQQIHILDKPSAATRNSRCRARGQGETETPQRNVYTDELATSHLSCHPMMLVVV